MEGGRRGKSLWKTMKQRLGFNAITICGSSCTNSSDNNVHHQISAPSRRRTGFRQQIPDAAAEGMNLATALAAERTSGKTFRSMLLPGQLQGGESTEGGSGRDPERSKGFDSVCCCVCMERNKDAAFIPCGHTYCRVCSRELWLNRGCCPLCNRYITDVLDLF